MTEEQKERTENGVAGFFDHSSFFVILLLLLILATGLYVLAAPHPVDIMELQEGQLAPANIYADFDFQVEDRRKSRELADKQVAEEPDYYKIDRLETEHAEQRYQDLFAAARKRESQEKRGGTFKADPGNPIQEEVEKLNPASLNFLLSIADNAGLKQKLDRLFRQYLQAGILDQKVRRRLHSDTYIKIIDPRNRRHRIKAEKLVTPETAARQMANEMLRTYQSPDSESIRRNFFSCLTAVLGGGNLFYDQQFTDGRKEEIRSSVEKIKKTFHQYETLLRKGKKVTAEDRHILSVYLDEQKKHAGIWEIYKRVGENILLCLALILAMGLYLFHVQPIFSRSNRKLWQLGLIIIAALLLNRLFMDGFLLLSEQIHLPRRDLLYFAIPIGFSSVLISVIFGARTAFFAGLFVSAIAALPMADQFQMFFTGLLINAGGALAVRNVQNYRSFFGRAFLGTSLTALLAAVIFFLKFMDKNNLQLIPWMILFPFMTGLLTAIMAQVGVYLLEMIFDVSTPLSLQTFYDFNHPLLKELQLKAPGTYHHCLMVSRLAEQAAEEAGLDPIKARVCGMFHDVGKLVQPEYFVENSHGRDMHRDQDPKMSAIIIRSHVAKHGPELAAKYKLKRLLYDTITQHHGNDIISFFYKKEQMLHPGENVKQSDFRYPGPIPSDKEICLVMLADCCEAASRSLDKSTPETISHLVEDIFRGKIRNGQLDDSELTMHELTIIKNSFINSLKTMFHGRIAYPKDDKKDEDDLFMAAGEDISPSK